METTNQQQQNRLENMNGIQKRCYDKAMNALLNVHQMLCNANGPLPSVVEQGKVIRIIQETKDKINELINKKL